MAVIALPPEKANPAEAGFVWGAPGLDPIPQESALTLPGHRRHTGVGALPGGKGPDPAHHALAYLPVR